MARLQASQVPKILFLALFLALLLSSPFISTSTRSSYLYFLLNLLIIVLGIEAGFISKPHEEKEKMATMASTAAEPLANYSSSDTTSVTVEPTLKPAVLEMKEKVKSLKRCKSRPSLFFIGEREDNDEEEVVEKKKVQEGEGEMSKQELFMKAEMFIGNFYKQLKVQREKSWQNN